MNDVAMNTGQATESAAKVELDDIQGLLRFGYKHHTEAAFLLLRVRDARAARAWLAQAPVANAVAADPLPKAILQLALTRQGLLAVGLPASIVDAFSPEFITGLGSDAWQARRLGDVAGNDPALWSWGSGERVPHVLVLLYAMPGQLADWQRLVTADCAAGFDLIEGMAASELEGREPFGFSDGISQPELDWARRRPPRDETNRAYDNLCCLGEFMLGYPNEYGGYTDRPLLDPAGNAQLLPRAEDAPDNADLGRNGSYLVMRQLEQDVAGFWHWLDEQTGSDVAGREVLAAALVGRTLDGEPLVAARGNDRNGFDFDADPDGVRCPIGAHIRRSNPRSGDLPPGDNQGFSRWLRMLGFDAAARQRDLLAPARFHRILRRGRRYGPTATTPADKCGLYFIALNASLSRQFEFIQAAWIANTHFNGLSGESDPLLGVREFDAAGRPTDGFSIPKADGPDCRFTGLPQFVTVRGGAYFFMPGIRALRYIATAGTST
jgi:deferrochelatase/peroxidase EfeB